MQKIGGKTLVLLTFALAIMLTMTVTGCGEKKPVVEAVASDACVACHISPDIIDSMYAPPPVVAGGGG